MTPMVTYHLSKLTEGSKKGKRGGKGLRIWETKQYCGDMSRAHLDARLSEVDAQAVCVPPVVLHQLLECPECSPPSYEESAFVQLPDPVVLHRIRLVPFSRGLVALFVL